MNKLKYTLNGEKVEKPLLVFIVTILCRIINITVNSFILLLFFNNVVINFFDVAPINYSQSVVLMLCKSFIENNIELTYNPQNK